jgi:GrpB-like predicted nucleotidyltransferase (UPF0157 family)
MRTISVVDYDSSWPVRFDAEAAVLYRTLGHVAHAIHHIGSTAVPGLAAKPIIDILMEAADLSQIDALNERMVGIGYIPKGEYGIPGRRYFQKGGEDRTHHLHVFARGDFNVVRHLAFRDYLRGHPDIAREYGELKRAVAKTCENDIERYCDGKDAYVKRIEAIAIREKPPSRQNMTHSETESVVQRQLDAFNARDIDALLAVYADDAQLFEHPAKLLASGSAEIRPRFVLRFQEPNLHAALLKRIVAGAMVVDHEKVSRTFPEGAGEIELVMIYEVKEGRIAKAWTITGAKKIFAAR